MNVRLLAPATVVALAAAPAVRAAEPAAGLPDLTAPSGWGVNIHFTDPKPGEMERFREAGYRWARMDLFWHEAEKKRGVYDFAAYDRLVDALTRAGVRPLFILDYGNDLYQKGAPTTKEARDAYARFAAAAAKRYAGRGVVWELWNEPNLSQFWQPRANAKDYAALAVGAARAIRRADAKATIIGPGASGFAWEFLEEAFRGGLLAEIDAVSIHPYRGTAPETVAADWARLRALVARHAPKAKKAMPFVSSEWGYSTREGGDISEERQAAYLCRMWLANQASGVGLSIFYDWRDDGDDPKENEHRFGTVRRDLSPKPSFDAARKLIASLSGYTLRHRLAGIDANDWRLLFQRGDSVDLALVTWNADPAGPSDRQTPVVRAVTPADAEYPAYRRLASVRIARPAGAVMAGAEAGPASSFSLMLVNPEPGRATFAYRITGGDGIAPISQSGSVTVSGVGAAAQTAVGLAEASARNEGYLLNVALSWDGRPLPAIAPLIVRRVDPLLVSAAPVEGGLRVSVENPAGTPFAGTAAFDPGPDGTAPLKLGKKERLATTTLPAPGDRPFAVALRDREGKVVVRSERLRLLPFPIFSDAPGVSPWARVAYVENETRPPVPLGTIRAPVGSPASIALKVPYRFEKGWRYDVVSPREPTPIPAGARALSLWVHSDGSGDFLRARFRDATGQTFQPDLPKLKWRGWRLLTIPLDGSGPGGHWGGAGTGVPIGALTWDGLLLIDSADRENPHGGELLVAAPAYVFPG